MLLRRAQAAVLAELLGTAALVCAVVGSGIMASRLTDDAGMRLVINAVATVAVLGVAIAAFVSTSGAHFNPVVTAALLVRRELPATTAMLYVGAQAGGAVLGTVVAHLMYEVPMVSTFSGDRGSPGQLLGEVIATTGLIVVILRCRSAVAITVPAWIAGAYFSTSSTSFANPAVTLGRAATDSFAGIAWSDVPAFWLAQFTGGAVALVVVRLLQEETS